MYKNTKRSYYLPGKLIKALDDAAEKCGFVRASVVAAAMLNFLQMLPADQAACLKRLYDYVPPGTYERATGRPRLGKRPKRYQLTRRQHIVVTDKMMRLQIPPANKQRVIG